MVVERKTYHDLVMSFNDGRLVRQVTAMCRFYSVPVLLIQMNENKEYESYETYKKRPLSVSDPIFKITVLTQNFRKLRLNYIY